MITRYNRSLTLLLLVLLQTIIPILAIYEHEAGAFDWHHTWIGHPRDAVKLDNKHIGVYSDKNVFASIDTETGVVAWRQLLDNDLDQFAASEAGIVIISSNPERTQFYNKTTGNLVWEYTLPSTEYFGSANPVVWNNGDVAVFIDKTQLVKLSSEGKEIWKWSRSVDEEQTFGRTKTILREDRIHIIFDPSDEEDESAFYIVTIDSKTGKEISSNEVPCDSSYDNIAYVGNYLFWTEEDEIKWTDIETIQVKTYSLETLVESIPTAEYFTPIVVQIIGDSTQPELNSFVLSSEYQGDNGYAVASALININENSLTLVKYFGAEQSNGGSDFHQNNVIRVVKSGNDEFTAHVLPEGKEYKFNQNFEISGGINFAKAIQLEPFGLLVSTEAASVFYYNASGLVWSREESLGGVTAAEFLDLPEQKSWAKVENADEAPLTRYLHRLSTHATELYKFPTWFIGHVVHMFSTTQPVRQTATQGCWLNQTQPHLYRDNFGLRKLLISVTSYGKIVAQDTENGQIVWSRFLTGFSFTQVHLIRPASLKPPVILAIGRTWDDVGGEATGFVRLNGLTGEDFISTLPETVNYFEPIVATTIGVDKVMKLPIEDPDEKTQILAVFEAGSGRIYIYPDTLAARNTFVSKVLPDFYFYYLHQEGQMKGYRVLEGFRGSLRTEVVWNFDLPEGEEVVAVTEGSADKVASLGRVLGNRNVLYKYLNPHSFALVTARHDKSIMTVRIIDAVKGSILYETSHDQIDTVHNSIHILQSENWFIYHYWNKDTKARGYQTTVLELFEGAEENQRVESGNFSSFDGIQPHVLSAAFAFPYPITTMGVTTTRNGISTKNVLFGLPTHQIFGINKRFFDPRRPTGKPSKEDQEEQLFPYGPIPDDKRSFLTYNLDVAGIKSIITSPSLLESTSLVYAFGLDTFFTRNSPSRQFDVLSEDFSKTQLLLTITGLIVAIWVTGPMVRKKRVNTLWK